MKSRPRITKPPFCQLIEKPRPGRVSRRRSQSGASLVELAVVLPFLLLLVLGAVDFGRAYYLSIEVANAARAGAQYGVRNSADIPGMQNAALSDGADVPGLSAVATSGCECSDGSDSVANCSSPPTCPGGAGGPIYLVNFVQVSTTATYRPVIPWPGGTISIPMSGQARLRTDQ
jgi:TadE-like protein